MAKKGTPGREPQILAGGKVNILDKAVCLTIRMGGLGNRAAVDSDRVETDADKRMIHVAKTLLDSKEFRRISIRSEQVRTFIRDHRALRCQSFGRGVYFLSLGLMDDVEGILTQLVKDRKQWVKEFLKVYPAKIAEAKKRLRSEFDPDDYPLAEEVEAAFSLDWSYITFSTPDALKKVSESVYDREKIKFAERLQEAAGEVEMVLKEAVAELLAWMVDRLSDRKDGKRKKFTDKMTSKLDDFFKTFPFRNLTDNQDLTKLVDQAHKIAKGMDLEAMKEDDKLRATVRGEFAKIQKTLGTMIEAKPTRKIVLDDED